LTEPQWREVSDKALALFAFGREMAARQGLILVDTKYEFGFDAKGAIVLADEVHTPDSSRYWLAASYPERFAAGAPPDTLDKDFIRRWVAARCDPYADSIPEIPQDVILQAAATYIDVYEKVTGRDFALPELSVAPLARVRANLKKYFEKAA
jgi:phosphoribosylaminoimidazole-succinocarboxamide synthase